MATLKELMGDKTRGDERKGSWLHYNIITKMARLLS